MTFDLHEILASKRAYRRALASRDILEKLAMLDKLRERAVTLRAPGPLATEVSPVLREDPRLMGGLNQTGGSEPGP